MLDLFRGCRCSSGPLCPRAAAARDDAAALASRRRLVISRPSPSRSSTRRFFPGGAALNRDAPLQHLGPLALGHCSSSSSDAPARSARPARPRDSTGRPFPSPSPPLSTHIFTLLVQVLVSMPWRLSWPVCSHQVSRSRGCTGGAPRIGGLEAAPLCLSARLSKACARRGPERPPWLRRVVAMCTLVNPVLRRSVISSWRFTYELGEEPNLVTHD